jgi:DNA-binding MarR family transcriptional regulator
VRGLAHELNISKPAVSRALDRLGELGYIRRERDDLDRRNVLVQRTEAGGQFLDNFSKMILSAAATTAEIPDSKQPSYALDAMVATAAALDTDGEDKTAQDWSTNVAA